MIYVARLMSVLGHFTMKFGVACLLVKVLFEPDLPEIAQGYWLEMFVAIGAGAIFLFIGTRFGSDIFGPDDDNADSVNTAIRGYHRSDSFFKMLYRYDLLRFFLHSSRGSGGGTTGWGDGDADCGD